MKVFTPFKIKLFKPYVVAKKVEEVNFKFLIADTTAQQWYDHKYQDWLEMRFIKEYLLEKGDTVFECGSHHGCSAVLLSRWVSDEGKVIAFESNPKNARILKKNIGLNNLRNVFVKQEAIGLKEGRVVVSNVSSSYVISSHMLEKGKIVKQSIFDKYIDLDPTFLKIDVEGYEVDVLKGAKNILQRMPKLAIEIHAEWLGNYDTSVDELLSLIDLKHYDCWIQWAENESPEPFDIRQKIVTRCHFFARPKIKI